MNLTKSMAQLYVCFILMVSLPADAASIKEENETINWGKRFQPKAANDPNRIAYENMPLMFQEFIERLRQAVQEKNIEAINAAISPKFYIARDFGGMFDPQASPAKNFSSCYQLNNSKLFPEYKDSGWRALAKVLSGNVFERVETGEICTPYGAMEKRPFPHEQLCFAAEKKSSWTITGHINGGD